MLDYFVEFRQDRNNIFGNCGLKALLL